MLSANAAYALSFVFSLAVAWFFAPLLYPHMGEAGAPSRLGSFATLAAMTFSLLGIASLAGYAGPERTGGILAYALTFAIGAAALWLLPEWSGIAAVGALVVLVAAPTVLMRLAEHHSAAGGRRIAAVCALLASRLHPSKPMRFYAAVLGARATRSTEAEIAAYTSLKVDATGQLHMALDGLIAFARDDWIGASSTTAAALPP